jgi:hypothetical protein
MNDHHRNELSNLPKPSVAISTVLPCDDLRQRLRKIYTIAITRYEKKQVFEKPLEEGNEL